MSTIKSTATVERTGDYPFQKIVDETVIVEPKAKLMHQLDEVGSNIWEFLDTPHTVEEIIAMIMENYDVDASRAETDVVQFLQEMEKRQLVKIKV